MSFALMLRFYIERDGFHVGRSEIPDVVVDYVARQVGVERTEIAFYEWASRTSKFHRSQIRQALRFRECTVAYAEVLTGWLVDHVTQVERGPERVHELLLWECRKRQLEPPTAGPIDRIIRSGLGRGEDVLIGRVTSRLLEPVCSTLVEQSWAAVRAWSETAR